MSSASVTSPARRAESATARAASNRSDAAQSRTVRTGEVTPASRSFGSRSRHRAWTPARSSFSRCRLRGKVTQGWSGCVLTSQPCATAALRWESTPVSRWASRRCSAAVGRAYRPRRVRWMAPAERALLTARGEVSAASARQDAHPPSRVNASTTRPEAISRGCPSLTGGAGGCPHVPTNRQRAPLAPALSWYAG